MQKNKDKQQQIQVEEEEEEISIDYVSIDTLQEHNINAADITKLKAAGICTVKGLLMVTRKELLNIKGITDQKIDKMIEAAQKLEVILFEFLEYFFKIYLLNNGFKFFYLFLILLTNLNFF